MKTTQTSHLHKVFDEELFLKLNKNPKLFFFVYILIIIIRSKKQLDDFTLPLIMTTFVFIRIKNKFKKKLDINVKILKAYKIVKNIFNSG